MLKKLRCYGVLHCYQWILKNISGSDWALRFKERFKIGEKDSFLCSRIYKNRISLLQVILPFDAISCSSISSFALWIKLHQSKKENVTPTLRSVKLETYQLWTINFCTASNASYLTFGSSCPNNCITSCLPPSCSITLKKNILLSYWFGILGLQLSAVFDLTSFRGDNAWHILRYQSWRHSTPADHAMSPVNELEFSTTRSSSHSNGLHFPSRT